MRYGNKPPHKISELREVARFIPGRLHRDTRFGFSLHLAERYVKGEIYALLTFTVSGDTSQYVALIDSRGVNYCGEGVPFWRHREHNLLCKIDGNRHEQTMIVGVIQGMEIPEV